MQALVDTSGLDRIRDEFGRGEFCEPMGDTLRCRCVNFAVMHAPTLRSKKPATSLRRSILPGLWLLLLPTLPALAQIYSCPAANGTVTYRQTPCPEALPESPAEAADTPAEEPPAGANADCEAAGRLAFATARLMQGGLGVDDSSRELGGQTLPAEARKLIDSVYAFRDDADLSAERIGALSETLCRGGSFGELNCNILPAGNARRAAGCAAQAQTAAAAIPTRRAAPAAASATLTAAEKQAVRRCREPVEARIEAIDVELRRGVRGAAAERHLEELLSLTDALRACAP